MFAVFVIFFVPVVPFAPTCGHDDKPIHARMTAHYRHFLKSVMQASGLYFWDIGGTILVTVSSWVDLPELWGGEVDRLVNAEGQTAFWMGLDRYERLRDGRLIESAASYEGRVVASKAYRVPEHVKALRDPVTGRYDSGSCEYRYAIVTGRLAPPEYRPKYRK